MGEPVLTVDGLHVSYGPATAVAGASLTVPAGRITALVGPNAAGKSSTLLAAFGAIASTGRVDLAGEDVSRRSQHARMERGLALVPQGRQLFPQLSVEDNVRLIVDLHRLPRSAVSRAYELFPVLGERRRSPAGVLSGGQQQMLALARAIITGPEVLLLDEAVDGLAAGTVATLMASVRQLADDGVGVLMAEPTLGPISAWVDRGYVMIRGRSTDEATSSLELERLYERELGIVDDDLRAHPTPGPAGGDPS